MFYVIETADNNTREIKIYISPEPGRTNVGHKQLINGWLGLSNGRSEYAHGEFISEKDAIKFIRLKWKDRDVHKVRDVNYYTAKWTGVH